MNIDEFAEQVYGFAVNEMHWSRDWKHGGCYLHLESSEFIEALRGKGDPLEELGDIFITLLSVAHHYGLKPSKAIGKAKEKMKVMIANKENFKN